MKLEKESYYNCDGPVPGGYEHCVKFPPRWREPTLPGRRNVAIARANHMGKPLGSFYGLRKHPSKNVGHLAYSVRPMRWCVQLEEDDLHMLVIPEAFYDYAKGRPSPPG